MAASGNSLNNEKYFIAILESNKQIPSFLQGLSQEQKNGVLIYPDPNDPSSSSTGARNYKACFIENYLLVCENERPKEVSMGNLTPAERSDHAKLIHRALVLADRKVPAGKKARQKRKRQKAKDEAAREALVMHLYEQDLAEAEQKQKEAKADNTLEHKTVVNSNPKDLTFDVIVALENLALDDTPHEGEVKDNDLPAMPSGASEHTQEIEQAAHEEMRRESRRFAFHRWIADPLTGLSDDSYNFVRAAALGKLMYLKTLGTSFDPKAFHYAHTAANEFGHLNILQYLDEISPTNLWLEYQDPQLLTNFASNYIEGIIKRGQLDMLIYIENKLPKDVTLLPNKDMTLLEFMTFSAMYSKHTDILKYLKSKMPVEQFQALVSKYMMREHFKNLFDKGYFETLKYIISTLSVTQMEEDHIADGLKDCIAKGMRKVGQQYEDIVRFIVRHPYVFACLVECQPDDVYKTAAETHVRPLISKQIKHLQIQKNTLQPPNKFDVHAMTALKCFYIIRYFIMHKEEENALENINFLLNIPAVRALASQNPISPIVARALASQSPFSLIVARAHDQPDLVTLAFNYNNRDVVKILLDIPEIRKSALQETNLIRLEWVQDILDKQMQQEMLLYPKVRHTFLMGIFKPKGSSLGTLKNDESHLIKEVLGFVKPTGKTKQ